MTKPAKKADLKVVRGAGDNDSEKPVDGEKLLGFVEDIEKIEKKKAQILQELRESYADAKAVGYVTKTIRAIVKERAMGPEKRKEMEDLKTLYKSALGMLDDE